MDHRDDVNLFLDQDVVNTVGEAPQWRSSYVQVNSRVEERIFLDQEEGGLYRFHESRS